MEEELRDIFATELKIANSDVTDQLAYAVHPKWDSLAHMSLVAAIEDKFDIYFEPDDVVDMSSFAVAKAIVKTYLK
jgi:acyl carrier protein